jgi:hypothetical protein
MGTLFLFIAIGMGMWIYREPAKKQIEEKGLQTALEDWSQKGIDYAKENPNDVMAALAVLLVADIAEDIDDIADS